MFTIEDIKNIKAKKLPVPKILTILTLPSKFCYLYLFFSTFYPDLVTKATDKNSCSGFSKMMRLHRLRIISLLYRYTGPEPYLRGVHS
jgi:hypothetical protein